MTSRRSIKGLFFALLLVIPASALAQSSDLALVWRPLQGTGDCGDYCGGWNADPATSGTNPQTRTCAFTDPLPSGARVRSITVNRLMGSQKQYTWQGVPFVTMRMNSTLLGPEQMITLYSFNCNSLSNHVFPSDYYPDGVPGYVYGGTNVLSTTLRSGNISTMGPEITFRYTLTVDVLVESGNGQRGVIGHPLEKEVVVRLKAPAGHDIAFKDIFFEFSAKPAKASGQAIGANENATTQTFTAKTDLNGYARATVVLGDKEGTYSVKASTPLSTTGATATFSSTALKPSAIRMTRDVPELATEQPSYAISPAQQLSLYAVAVDAAGIKIGPVKCNWSVSGKGSTAGGGTLSPTSSTVSSVFSPTKVGAVVVTATPLLKGVSGATKDVFVSAIFLRVEGEVDVNNPVDQSDQFLPGARLDKSSLSPAELPQEVKLHVLSSPGSSGQITFSLTNVSRYPGIAMNYPVTGASSDPDMYFAGGASSVTVPFSSTGNTAVTLLVNDYAAYGELTATLNTDRKTFVMTLKLPKDDNANRIADGGWVAGTVAIADSALGPGLDEDVNPQMRAITTPDGGGGFGDNLTNAEEYRGFVFFGIHRRTNPHHKDLFIEAADFGDDIAFAFPAFPTATHRVSVTDISSDQIVNFNHAGLPGAADSAPHGHWDVKAVSIKDAGTSSLGFGQTDCITPYFNSPNVPNYCPRIYIYQASISERASSDGVTDADLIIKLRRSTVAHEAGHTVNLFHNTSTECLMFGEGFEAQGGWANIPTEFCSVSPINIYECAPCGPTGSMTITNETDTLRLKEDLRVPKPD